MSSGGHTQELWGLTIEHLTQHAMVGLNREREGGTRGKPWADQLMVPAEHPARPCVCPPGTQSQSAGSYNARRGWCLEFEFRVTHFPRRPPATAQWPDWFSTRRCQQFVLRRRCGCRRCGCSWLADRHGSKACPSSSARSIARRMAWSAATIPPHRPRLLPAPSIVVSQQEYSLCTLSQVLRRGKETVSAPLRVTQRESVTLVGV